MNEYGGKWHLASDKVLLVKCLPTYFAFQINNNIVEGLLDHLAPDQPELVRPILRLLFNFSFNQDLCASMMKLDLPRKLVPLISKKIIIFELLT